MVTDQCLTVSYGFSKLEPLGEICQKNLGVGRLYIKDLRDGPKFQYGKIFLMDL